VDCKPLFLPLPIIKNTIKKITTNAPSFEHLHYSYNYKGGPKGAPGEQSWSGAF